MKCNHCNQRISQKGMSTAELLRVTGIDRNRFINWRDRYSPPFDGELSHENGTGWHRRYSARDAELAAVLNSINNYIMFPACLKLAMELVEAHPVIAYIWDEPDGSYTWGIRYDARRPISLVVQVHQILKRVRANLMSVAA